MGFGEMLNIWLCLSAFLCFFLYDWNQTTKKINIFDHFFWLGCILWAIATVRLLRSGWLTVGYRGFIQIFFGVLSVISLIFMIYSLFFALPLKETYVEKQSELMPVCEEGFYGLCRHPGFLWYFGFYLFGSFALPCHEFFFGSVLLCLCNFLYIWAEDTVFFPQMFSNYDEYRERVPFLIPNRTSILMCCQTLKGRKKV